MKIIIIIIYSWISLPIILGYVCCEFSIFPSLVGLFLFELTHLVCYLSWSVGCLIFKFTQFLSFSKLVTNSPYKRRARLVPKLHQRVSLSCRELFLSSPFFDLCWRVFLLFISFFRPFGIKSVLKTIVPFRFNVPSKLRTVLKT